MAKLLSEILNTRKGVDLRFIDLQQDETIDGDPIVLLVLEEPIEFVFGRTITNRRTNERIKLQVNDVEIVKIGKSTLDDIDIWEKAGENVIEWEEEGKSGRIKSDKLFLDVSNGLEAWVTSVKFAEFGAMTREAARAKQFETLADRVKSGNVRKEFKNIDAKMAAEGKKEKEEPEVVAEKQD